MRYILFFSVFFTAALSAETHQITVYENRFSPEVQVVQPGDSVQWVVAAGNHQIFATENDQSIEFVSPPLAPNSQFTTEISGSGGEVYYRSSAVVGMQGALVVEAPANDFVIDERIIATYHNPATPGQGLLFEYVPATNFLVAYWFTYNKADGSQQWLIATGTPNGNKVNLAVLKPSGGKFNDPQAVNNQTWGELTIEFESCYRATVYFNAAAEQHAGQFDVERLYSAGPCENEVTP